MTNPAFDQILAGSSTPEAIESTVNYLTNHLKPIVRQGESVLICFPRERETDFGAMIQQAVLRCDGQPVFWENDLRWKELLRLSFVSKASTIIAPPLIVLGLAKLAAFQGIPLYFFNVILAGYPCLDWMMDGIETGLDCKIWGFLGPGITSVVGGFSCNCGRGVHLRDDTFGVEIVDSEGNELPDGQQGRIVLYSLATPNVRFITRFCASIMNHKCPCGNDSVKLLDIEVGETQYHPMLKIAEDLLYWYSILDCRVQRNEYGLEIEVVCFPGEKMPKLPSCAKLTVRDWNPETDIPLSLSEGWTNP